jgi:hypothetical protein
MPLRCRQVLGLAADEQAEFGCKSQSINQSNPGLGNSALFLVQDSYQGRRAAYPRGQQWLNTHMESSMIPCSDSLTYPLQVWQELDIVLVLVQGTPS